MKKPLHYINIIAVVIVSILFYNAVSPDKVDVINDNDQTNTHENYKIKALELPKNINLAGERVPLEIPDVKERMDSQG